MVEEPSCLVNPVAVSVQELRKAYEELSEADRVLFATFVAADELARQDESAADLTRHHKAMDGGKKRTHADLLKLRRDLDKQGL